MNGEFAIFVNIFCKCSIFAQPHANNKKKITSTESNASQAYPEDYSRGFGPTQANKPQYFDGAATKNHDNLPSKKKKMAEQTSTWLLLALRAEMRLMSSWLVDCHVKIHEKHMLLAQWMWKLLA